MGNNDWDNFPVARVGFLSPNATVFKCGRSTEITNGVVNGLFLQKWSENRVTTEIAIIGCARGVEEKGDSGLLVVIEEQKNLAGGLLVGKMVGKNNFSNFAIVTPLYIILEQEMGQYQWM